jgi:hypothetical protein
MKMNIKTNNTYLEHGKSAWCRHRSVGGGGRGDCSIGAMRREKEFIFCTMAMTR